MARDLGTTNTEQVQAGEVRPVVFAQLDFYGGTVRAHTGIGDITWGGNTWSGVGDFAGVGEIEEGTDIAARGVSLSINGIPSAVLSEALGAKYRGRAAKIWLGFLNASGALLADPYQVFGGRMDVMSVEDAGDTCSISVQCENRLVDFRRSRVSRYTQEDQNARFPMDFGLQYIARIADQTIQWGPVNSNTSASSAASSNAMRTAIITRWH